MLFHASTVMSRTPRRYVVTLHLGGTIIDLCSLRAYMSCSICRLAPVNHVTVVF